MSRYDDEEPFRGRGNGRTGYVALISLIGIILTLIGIVIYLIVVPDEENIIDQAVQNVDLTPFQKASSSEKEGEPTEGEKNKQAISSLTPSEILNLYSSRVPIIPSDSINILSQEILSDDEGEFLDEGPSEEELIIEERRSTAAEVLLEEIDFGEVERMRLEQEQFEKDLNELVLMLNMMHSGYVSYKLDEAYQEDVGKR